MTTRLYYVDRFTSSVETKTETSARTKPPQQEIRKKMTVWVFGLPVITISAIDHHVLQEWLSTLAGLLH